VLPQAVSIRILLDHIDYMVIFLIGIDHVGISSDFDGVAVFAVGQMHPKPQCFTLELGRRGLFLKSKSPNFGAVKFTRVLDRYRES